MILICLKGRLVCGDKHDDEKRLIDTVMRDYNKDAFPDNTVLTGLGFVNVSIHVTPLYLNIVSSSLPLSYTQLNIFSIYIFML